MTLSKQVLKTDSNDVLWTVADIHQAMQLIDNTQKSVVITTGKLGLVPKLNEDYEKRVFNKDKEYQLIIKNEVYEKEMTCKGVWVNVTVPPLISNVSAICIYNEEVDNEYIN